MHRRRVTVAPLNDALTTGQRALAVVAGLLMIAMALQVFGLVRGRHRWPAIGIGGSALGSALRNLQRAEGFAAHVALGVFNGFLPCPLVYAFAAQAAATFSPLSGALTMVLFGLGTFPAMFLIGNAGPLLGLQWRQRGVWLAGGFVGVLGLITLARGVLPIAGHLGHLSLAGLGP